MSKSIIMLNVQNRSVRKFSILVQDCGNSIIYTLELLQSYTKLELCLAFIHISYITNVLQLFSSQMTFY